MTRTLYLLRHAKSSRDEPGVRDFERPLAGRGRKAAPRIARYMRGEGLLPDLILCSAARRATETLDGVAPELGPDIPTKRLKSLYDAAPGRILEVIHGLPDEAPSAMVIGHNPGLETLAIELAGPGSEARALARLTRKFPTAALAVIVLEIASWRDVAPGRGRLVRLVRPRDLARPAPTGGRRRRGRSG